MHVLDANELFGITSYTYDRIMEVGGKQGPDAFALYFKLMKQARIQQTNQTYSLNSFLKDGMGWGTDRLRNAKNILKNLGLVDDVNLQDEKGKIIGHYVRVNYLVDEEKVRTAGMTYNLSTCGLGPQMDENHQWTPATCGGTATNALSTKYINAGSTKIENNCLSEKKTTTSSKKKKRTTNEHLLEGETKEKFEKFWNTYPHVTGRSSRKESIPLFLEHNPDDLVVGASILKWEVESGKQQDEFVKASERWLKNFTPMTDSYKKRKIKEIIKRHMDVGGDKKTRFEEMQKDFEGVDLKAIAAEIRDEKTMKLIESFK